MRHPRAEDKFRLNERVKVSAAGIAAGLDTSQEGVIDGFDQDGESVRVLKGSHRGYWHMDFWEPIGPTPTMG